MIHALLQYAQDRGLASKPGFAKKTIKWILNFDSSGSRFTGLVKSDKQFESAPDLSHPELLALGAQKGQAAHFLVAPLGTFLAWSMDPDSEVKECGRRETLSWMLKEAGKTDSGLDALSGALLDDQIAPAMREAALSIKPVAKPTHLATVRIGGRFPVEEDTWHQWWDEFRASLRQPATNKLKFMMVCFGTGELVEPETTHPKLKKLSGVGLSQPHAPIITFDKQAFESYGLRQAQNAPMSSETANRYVNAIDHLLENSVVFSWHRPKTKAAKELRPDYAKLGGARLVYWYTGPTSARQEVEEYNDLISLVLGSASKEEALPENTEEVRVLAESRLRQAIGRIRSGKAGRAVGEVRFCVLALSGAGGRAMVRDFFEGYILHLAETTERWFDDLALETYWGRLGHPPSFEQVLTAPLPEKAREQEYLKWVAPCGTWRQSLWRAALTGGRLPNTAFERALLSHNVTVVQGELTDREKGPKAQKRSHLRLAIVKAHLIRKGITMKPALEPEHPSPAYHCGRLLAVYNSLQRAAQGDVGAGVVQRYYGGALTNPAGVFGQLSRLAQTHLSKPEVPSRIYEKLISEIHNGIRRIGDSSASYPTALSLEDQALFALGFWHQIAATNKEIVYAAAVKKQRGESSKNDQAHQEDKDNE